MKGAIEVRRHTTMPKRVQKTPFGEVDLTSRWMRDRYYLLATGDSQSLKWLFGNKKIKLENHGKKFRHAFPPAIKAITVERELQGICRRWQDKWDEKLDNQPDDVHDFDGIRTVRDLVRFLGPIRDKDLKPSTRETDHHCMKRWSEVLDFNLALNDLNYVVLHTAYAQLRSNLKPSTVNRALGVLKTYLNWAVEEGLMNHASHKKLKKLKVYKSHRDIKWWSKEEVETVLSCARTVDSEINDRRENKHFHTSELLIAIGCYIGLRYEEIIMLRWQDVELDLMHSETGELIPVCHVVPHSGWEPKDGESRVIPIRRELLGILEKCKKKSGYILIPENNCRKTGGLKRVYRYDPKKLWTRVLELAMQKGVKRITPNGMRHTFASNLIGVGVSDVKIAMWLGHSNTDMVHKHYGHLFAYDNDINR